MPYFTHGEDKDRLSILYFMKHVGCALTRSQLYRVMAENGWINYFEYQTAVLGLAEQGFLKEIEGTFGMSYLLSAEGYQVVELFEKQLPHSFREAMRTYAEAHREQLRRETQFETACRRQKDGSTLVELKALDGEATVLELRFSAPTYELAKKAAAAWPLAAEEVFLEIQKKLFR